MTNTKMKNNFGVEGTPLVPYENIPSIRAESPPAETSADLANDFGERLMKLPSELRQKILFSLTPKERCHLRLVSKAVLDAADASMSDVERIEIVSAAYLKDTSYISVIAINPYIGAEKRYVHKCTPSMLPYLLKLVGAQLKTLVIHNYVGKPDDDSSHLRSLYQLFEALNSDNPCPKLKHISLTMSQSIWDNDGIIQNGLLNYVTMRQLQAMTAEHPIPFLHSLTFTDSPDPTSSETSAVDPLHSEKRRKFLQDLLDQCHGLKELDVDSLLVQKDLPLVALRYPTTLTYLNSDLLDETPGTLPTIVSNCLNLQVVHLNARFPHNDADIHALASLSDLRELVLMIYPTEEEIALMTKHCFGAFEDHPFGASIARPWPQLRSITLKCGRVGKDKHPPHRLLLSCANCSITSLHLTRCPRQHDSPYADSVEQLFQALNNENACPDLMELNISSCELSNRIADSLASRNVRHHRILEQSPISFPYFLPVPGPFIYGMLNDVLTYVTKRQSAARLGKPFLHSLLITQSCNYCLTGDRPSISMFELHDQLEKIHDKLQRILDQCHGLKELLVDSVLISMSLPLVSLHYPMTLTDLKSKRFNEAPGTLQAIVSNCPNLQSVHLKDGFLREDAEVDALGAFYCLPSLASICSNIYDVKDSKLFDSDTVYSIISCIFRMQNLERLLNHIQYSSTLIIVNDVYTIFLVSLSDLRELTLETFLKVEDSVQTFSKCLTAVKDYPFGASVARPWPQLQSITLDFYDFYKRPEHADFFLLLKVTNCCITALHLTPLSFCYESFYPQSICQLLEAMNSEDACPNLMELSIDSCDLAEHIGNSLASTKDCELEEFQNWLGGFGDKPLIVPQSNVFDILNDLLAYVTKRQSAVQLGKPFLRSLSIGRGECYCGDSRSELASLDELRDQLEQICTIFQQILDQCHGLEELFIESLNEECVNPDFIGGKELIELVSVRFPRTLKKLNDAWLDNTSGS